jgi:hypothetical protein
MMMSIEMIITLIIILFAIVLIRVIQQKKEQTKKKVNISEDGDAFKVKDDGTIVRIDKTSNTDEYSQTEAEKKHEDRTVREIEEGSFSLINSDYIYWTTQGTNSDIHLFRDCSVFHGRKVLEGNIRTAVEYFFRDREVQNLSICETCKQRAKNNNKIN